MLLRSALLLAAVVMAVGGERSGHRGFRRPALPVAATHACHAAFVEPNARLERLSGRVRWLLDSSDTPPHLKSARVARLRSSVDQVPGKRRSSIFCVGLLSPIRDMFSLTGYRWTEPTPRSGQIALASQDPELVDGTILENITYGESASIGDAKRAASLCRGARIYRKTAAGV